MTEHANEIEIQTLGMSRSGNHAIANWIFALSGAPKLYLNCAEGKTDPFETCRPLDSGLAWRAEGVDVGAERAGRRQRKRLLMHSYEDSWLAHAFSRPLEENHDAWLGRSARRVPLIVLRDPYNLFASRLRMGAALSPMVARRMWKQHAREALGETRRLKGRAVTALYNRWARDPEYRAGLAERLGFAGAEADISRVAACNGGSSFDGLGYDGQADRMPVDRRWLAYRDDPTFRDLIDDEMAELSERLFGPVAELPPAEEGPRDAAMAAG